MLAFDVLWAAVKILVIVLGGSFLVWWVTLPFAGPFVFFTSEGKSQRKRYTISVVVSFVMCILFSGYAVVVGREVVKGQLEWLLP